jgi:hypothetical protein
MQHRVSNQRKNPIKPHPDVHGKRGIELCEPGKGKNPKTPSAVAVYDNRRNSKYQTFWAQKNPKKIYPGRFVLELVYYFIPFLRFSKYRGIFS